MWYLKKMIQIALHKMEIEPQIEKMVTKGERG